MSVRKAGSLFSVCSAATTAASIGTLVNSDSTSVDTMISFSRILSLLTVDTKWAELFTTKPELAVKGDKI